MVNVRISGKFTKAMTTKRGRRASRCAVVGGGVFRDAYDTDCLVNTLCHPLPFSTLREEWARTEVWKHWHIEVKHNSMTLKFPTRQFPVYNQRSLKFQQRTELFIWILFDYCLFFQRPGYSESIFFSQMLLLFTFMLACLDFYTMSQKETMNFLISHSLMCAIVFTHFLLKTDQIPS